MKRLSPDEKEKLREELRKYHEDNLIRTAKAADLGYETERDVRMGSRAFGEVGIWLGMFFCFILAYRSGVIKVTQNFMLGVVATTGGIALLYIAGLLLNLFGVSVPFIRSTGPIGIIFSLIVVGVADLNLVLAFGFFEKGVESGAPKYMEWYAVFSLIVMPFWLVLEAPRLLAKIRSRRQKKRAIEKI